MYKARVLIVDDEQAARVSLTEIIGASGYETQTAGDGVEALEVAKTFQPGAVITDVFMPRLDGFGLLARLRDEYPETSVILLTGQGSVEDAVRSVIEEGAFYYFEKPINTRQLKVVLQRAIERSATQLENTRLRRQLGEYGIFGRLVGASHSMRQIYTTIEQVASSAVSVLITGESGTGKEVVANTIHQLSPRISRPFVAINCSAIPESLMESELFGHERGAFTGAIAKREGCFELANTGTLFLDEIAEMSVMLQAKLLRVLEDRKVRRLGSSKEVPVDAHVHRDLFRAAEPPHLAVFEHAQQLRLQHHRHLGDLIQEERARVGQLEAAFAFGYRAGEGAALVAEELRFHQRFWNSRAVDRYEGARDAGTELMNGVRYDLLARARFAGDQNGDRRTGYLLDSRVNLPHRV